MINAKGVIVDSSKVITMLEWLDSKNVKLLRGFIGLMGREFLGLIGYYRKFIKNNCGHIAAPFTILLKRNSFIGI